jgi:hypothetical protein
MLDLIATVICCCERPREAGPGHPPIETVRVLATLRRFLREGTPWRSLRATEDVVSGSTLRRDLARWARTGLLARVHALLVAMLRGDPTLILDSCSVRAKRGGDLTGPNPTDSPQCAALSAEQARHETPRGGHRRRHPRRVCGDGSQRQRHGRTLVANSGLSVRSRRQRTRIGSFRRIGGGLLFPLDKPLGRSGEFATR